MTCEYCATAAGIFDDDCRECSARFLARSLVYAQAEAKGMITADYRRALELEFGDDWMAGHRLVKGARARDCAP